MSMQNTVILRRADASDCDAILQMQKDCFAALLEKYQDYALNPANEKAEQVAARLLQPETYYYYITADGERVGAIRIVDAKDGSRKRSGYTVHRTGRSPRSCRSRATVICMRKWAITAPVSRRSSMRA